MNRKDLIIELVAHAVLGLAECILLPWDASIEETRSIDRSNNTLEYLTELLAKAKECEREITDEGEMNFLRICRGRLNLLTRLYSSETWKDLDEEEKKYILLAMSAEELADDVGGYW